MKQPSDLKNILSLIDGKEYKAYKDLEGIYQWSRFRLAIDHVQGDPFASPSRFRVQVPLKTGLFPRDTLIQPIRRMALCDYLTRQFYKNIGKHVKGRRGSGKSGSISITCPGQEVLSRTSVLVDKDKLEARFVVGLPAAGRRVLAQQAEEMIFSEIPAVVEESLFYASFDSQDLYAQLKSVEDQDHLRSQLNRLGLVAFVANGSLLPRMSGVDPRPLKKGAIPFSAPKSLELAVELPNSGRIRGLGIPQGITLIVGGGYHGKSTLLNALMLGVFNHLPGDGRERVVTVPDAAKIRAEDGRSLVKLDISPFINNLPLAKSTQEFSSDNASGSTSQAGNIMEALEIDTSLLLVDEDTSATNFMIRDHRMQELVEKKNEPITPFIDKVRQLKEELSVSTILVMGGSGDYFDVADIVIMMDNYQPKDVTETALAIAAKYAAERKKEGGPSFGNVPARILKGESLSARQGKREAKVETRGRYTILFGTSLIDLSSVEQLVEEAQTRAIGLALLYLKDHYLTTGRPLKTILDDLEKELISKGLGVLSSHKLGNLAWPRKLEIGAAINRLRGLKVV